MKYRRMPIEIESPEQMGYANVRLNLTESSMQDMHFSDVGVDLKNTVLSYGDHQGKPELRTLIASEHGLSSDEILITPSAASALFMVNTSLLEPGDHIIVMRPNYATNIETPRAIGCEIDFVELKIENDYQTDISAIEKLIRKNTKLISITTPHNPTGKMLSLQELQAITKIAVDNNLYLLVDETYRDLSFIPLPPIAASLSEKVISISSMSKAFGLPGIRIGWIVSRNKELMNTLLAAKEQIFICNSIIDEQIAFQFLNRKESYFPPIKEKALANLNILKDWLSSQDFMDYVLPQGGVVCFPRINKPVDIELFYRLLNEKYQTFVGAGHWFEMDKRYFRIGFGWPTGEELKEGLECIERAYLEARQG